MPEPSTPGEPPRTAEPGASPGTGNPGAPPEPEPAAAPRRRAGGAAFRLVMSALVAVAVAVTVTVLWLITGLGSFWPMWVWFGLACALAAQVTLERTMETTGAGRWYAFHESATASIGGILLLVWLLSGSDTFWPGWPIFTLALLLLVHYVVREQAPMYRAQVLMDRVDELTQSRSGALDVQAAELRRIERDLHDGAQARLVALSMQLGRAEQRLGADADPQTLSLIKGAQEDARLAIAELRDLARGIAPPVLTDRGLAAAVEALGKRSPLEVEVTAQLTVRPAPVVESAAYFVVAEALTNAAKHTPGAAVKVTLLGDERRLQIVVADDGIGGADQDGGGLRGLRQRVSALDGTLVIVSPEGAGTTVTAELPCGA